MIPLLIPIRGVHSAMSRLRKDLDDSLVNNLVEELLSRALRAVPRKEYEIIILTSDGELAARMKSNGYRVVLDDGQSLNKAVAGAVKSLISEHVALLMPDLPQIKEDTFEKIGRVSSLFSQVLVPTFDNGTAFAILERRFWEQDALGESSYSKFVELLDKEHSAFATHIIQEIQRDMDTMEDYEFWGFNLQR